MIRTNLFRKYFLVTALIVLIFIFLSIQGMRLMHHLRLGMNPEEGRHFVFYAHLIDHLHADNRAKALAEIDEWNTSHPPFRLAILDQNGKSIYPPSYETHLNWERVKKPQNDYDSISMPNRANPGPPRTLIRFAGSPAEYLLVTPEPHDRPLFFVSIASLVISVLLGIALSMALLFRSLREKAALADSVLAELQKGNLKARFPVTRMDEIGQAMSRFNRMADEIERLVEQLRSIEKSRMTLLQELAHDLRTPVASLKNLLETTSSKGREIDVKLRDELLQLALKEVEYFERLVEDLLVLAQISEPRYHAERKPLALTDLLEDEAESVAAHTPEISLKKELPDSPVEIHGDPHLLRRMIRNALENAFSFAKSEVRVSLATSESEFQIQVDDDGPGFSGEALEVYGERRVTRVMSSPSGGRLSVGLGSVILKNIAQIHGGSIAAGNRASGGASVVITLPRARS